MTARIISSLDRPCPPLGSFLPPCVYSTLVSSHGREQCHFFRHVCILLLCLTFREPLTVLLFASDTAAALLLVSNRSNVVSLLLALLKCWFRVHRAAHTFEHVGANLNYHDAARTLRASACTSCL